jgi:hypothetical protein
LPKNTCISFPITGTTGTYSGFLRIYYHRLTAPQTAIAFGGAVTRISISRPPQPVQVNGRIPTTGLPAPRTTSRVQLL